MALELKSMPLSADMDMFAEDTTDRACVPQYTTRQADYSASLPPFEGHGDINITRMEDFEPIARNVNQGLSTYQGYTLHLLSSIDASGYSGYVPIGVYDSAMNFRGEFDGHGFFIENLVISSSIRGTALFGSVQSPGRIRDLNLNRLSVVSTFGVMASIAAYNKGGASISGCSVQDCLLSSASSNIGGICGSSPGNAGWKVTDCLFRGRIVGHYKGSGGWYGGIASMVNGSGLVISGCSSYVQLDMPDAPGSVSAVIETDEARRAFGPIHGEIIDTAQNYTVRDNHVMMYAINAGDCSLVDKTAECPFMAFESE